MKIERLAGRIARGAGTPFLVRTTSVPAFDDIDAAITDTSELRSSRGSTRDGIGWATIVEAGVGAFYVRESHGRDEVLANLRVFVDRIGVEEDQLEAVHEPIPARPTRVPYRDPVAVILYATPECDESFDFVAKAERFVDNLGVRFSLFESLDPDLELGPLELAYLRQIEVKRRAGIAPYAAADTEPETRLALGIRGGQLIRVEIDPRSEDVDPLAVVAERANQLLGVVGEWPAAGVSIDVRPEGARYSPERPPNPVTGDSTPGDLVSPTETLRDASWWQSITDRQLDTLAPLPLECHRVQGGLMIGDLDEWINYPDVTRDRARQLVAPLLAPPADTGGEVVPL